MINLKALAASALIAVTTLGAVAPAQAQSTNCWILGNYPTASRKPFRCNVDRRVNANGHTVFDVTHYKGNGASFTVVFWSNNIAEIIVPGKSPIKLRAYTDKDGDQRLVANDMEFVISI